MYPILKFPNNILKQPARVIDLEKDMAGVKDLAQRMIETMRSKQALGVAAPQVGYSMRMFVMRSDKEYAKFETQKRNEKGILKMVNPIIIWKSEQKETTDESCLSFDEVPARLSRHIAVEVEWYDLRAGQPMRDIFKGLEARCIQHEIDHLDGILMTDRLGPLKNILVSKFYKAQR